MVFLLAALSALFCVLYLKERSKAARMERDYNYINLRLCEIANQEGTGYILVPSDLMAVKDTAENINELLKKFYERQVDYNRGQKAILQVFTNISHDLRTPITVLRGYIEMLYLQSRKEQLPPAVHTTIEKMETNSKELVHSVNNLLDMAKIQSGDRVLNLQKTNLTQVCREIVLEFYDLLEKENFRVEVSIGDKPVYATADAEAVQRILKNLIDNAIKYGAPGKFLGIALCEKQDGIFIEIEDHGPGISEQEKELVFTRAYAADRKKGSGLGLAICQGLAAGMGGSISVHSLSFAKTVFTVKLQR